MAKIAVVLTGSGYLDGSEIREAVATLYSLDKLGENYDCFALNHNQRDVVNHQAQKPEGEPRNMLIEAARITRGNVKPLVELKPEDYKALLLPGGFGVAKNLCDFALKGSEGTVVPKVANILDGFYNAKKPIGAICIAPALLALQFKGKELTLTVGEESDASKEIKKLGHKHKQTKTTECVVDSQNKVVSTPAYMYDKAPVHEVFEGIEKLVKATLKMA